MRQTIGSYKIQEVLGRGGMGVVYRATHETLAREVAIKALAPELTREPEFRERFFSEARTQARLQHPNIVTIYDLLEDGGEYFIVMEYVRGRSLDQQMAEARLSRDEAFRVLAHVLRALDAAHSQGVIHRDVKSSNVLVAEDGAVKLMDFGIALLVGDTRLTRSAHTIGTPIYMSPEQILRPREVDHRTDLYSAGILLYEMLTGAPPFEAETEYEVKRHHVETPFLEIAASRPTLSGPLIDLLCRALAKYPDERFHSAGEFLKALPGAAGSGLESLPPPPPVPVASPVINPDSPSTVESPSGPPNGPRRFRFGEGRGRARRIGSVAVLVVVMLVGVSGLLWLSTRPSPTGDSAEGDTRPLRVVSHEPAVIERDEPDPYVVVLPPDHRPPLPRDDRPSDRPKRVVPPSSPPPPPPPPVREPTPVEPEPEPEPEPAIDPDESIQQAGEIAERLPDDIDRFEDSYGRRFDDLLEDQLDDLLDMAKDFRKAYRAVASREGLRGKESLMQRASRLYDLNREDVWVRAGETVRLGRSVSETIRRSFSEGDPIRQRWRDLEADLEALERLSQKTGD